VSIPIVPRLALRRADAKLTIALAGTILAVDLLWGLLVGSTGHLAYGLVDLPAHLATCGIALLAAAAVTGRLPARFVAAALVASVAIDIDHVPGLFGSHLLSGASPRPHSHSLAIPAILLLVAGLKGGRTRQLALGAAFGIGAHLLRDLATGPGVPLLWPAWSGTIVVSYVGFAVALLLAAALSGAALLRSASVPTRVANPIVSQPGVLSALLAGALASCLIGPGSAAAVPRISMGAYISGSEEDPALIDAYGAEVGGSPVIVSSYRDWARPLIDTAQLDAAWARGAVPLVTWEPWVWNADGSFPLGAIAKGRYDAYVAEAAQAAAAWGNPILLRFAHEMNGGWYPWGTGKDGPTPTTYVKAWRHLVRVFRANGADNVKWVWTPYVRVGDRFPFARFYPGDRWVSWVGFDGLNGGAVFGWRSFAKIFTDSYRELVRITSRPIIVAETGSAEEGGLKAAWLSQGLRRAMPRFPHIRALVWWSVHDYRGDFSVGSSSPALDVLREVNAMPRYQSSRDLLLATPPRVGAPVRRENRRSPAAR
jgi:membrane-bound metal-dependent hydrolase YbcI (DUF457 family)